MGRETNGYGTVLPGTGSTASYTMTSDVRERAVLLNGCEEHDVERKGDENDLGMERKRLGRKENRKHTKTTYL